MQHIFIEFIRLWAYLYFLSIGVHYFIEYLAKKSNKIKAFVPYLFSISTAIHEFAHHIMAKFTGAEAKLENIDFKKGTYTYLEKDKTLLKSILVSLAPSILGSLLIYEILRFIKTSQNYPFWLYFILNLLIVFIFIGIPSSSADFYLIIKTLSENPINLLTTIMKSSITIIIIVYYHDIISRWIAIRSPYLELIAFGALYFCMRVVFLLIPIKLLKKAKKNNEKRLITNGPRVHTPRKIRNPNYYIQSQKQERNPEKEFFGDLSSIAASKPFIEVERLSESLRKATIIEDQKLSLVLLHQPEPELFYVHKGYDKMDKYASSSRELTKIQEYMWNKQMEFEKNLEVKKPENKAPNESDLLHEIGMYIAILNKIAYLNPNSILFPSEALIDLYAPDLNLENQEALVLKLRKIFKANYNLQRKSDKAANQLGIVYPKSRVKFPFNADSKNA